MTRDATVHGSCDARFSRVRDLFAEQLAQPDELGAALAVTLDGRSVVDLWGGHADAARSRPWTADTLVNVFSTTKGMAALCAHRLADQDRLDLDAPVARYWPEFARAGKEAIPVRWLLDHSAGLAAVEKPLPTGALCEWDVMASALVEQTPLWDPGTAHGYHALTFGWLVGEVVRRVAGRSVGRYFRDEIAAPLGADFWIGTDAALDARTAELVPAPMTPRPGEANFLLELIAKGKPWVLKSFVNPLPPAGGMNARAWRAAEIPAANGHASARGLARVYTALACGGTLEGVGVLSKGQVDVARTEQRHGADEVLPLRTRFALGYQLGTEAEPIGPGRAFGHAGAGGSLGFADPEARIGFGYVVNRMESGLFLIGPRATTLMNAVFASL